MRFVVLVKSIPWVAVIVAVTLPGPGTLCVNPLKLALEAPDGMVTVLGTDAAGLLEERASVMPLGPTVEEAETVPVKLVPPRIGLGATEIEVSDIGLTVMVRQMLFPSWAKMSALD